MDRAIRRFTTTGLLVLAAAAAGLEGRQAARTIRVTDFGAEPGSRKSAVAAVQKALEACRRT